MLYLKFISSVMDPEFYVNQYEPRSVNYDNVDKEEALARRRLQESWKHFDRTSKRPNASDIASTSRSSENNVKKWDFEEIKKEQEKQESEDENQKPEVITIQESKNNEENEPEERRNVITIGDIDLEHVKLGISKIS